MRFRRGGANSRSEAGGRYSSGPSEREDFLQGRQMCRLDGQQERVGKLGREFSGISAVRPVADCDDECVNVGQTLGVDVWREIVAWEDDFDRDVGDSVGLPKRAVGPMPFLVVENRAAGLVALGLDVNALDEVVDDANLLGWCRCVEATAKSHISSAGHLSDAGLPLSAAGSTSRCRVHVSSG